MPGRVGWHALSAAKGVASHRPRPSFLTGAPPKMDRPIFTRPLVANYRILVMPGRAHTG
jgi:hypothetical protein